MNTPSTQILFLNTILSGEMADSRVAKHKWSLEGFLPKSLKVLKE